MKKIMREEEMERYLMSLGYDIEIPETDGTNDMVIDSSLVCDYAAELGYRAVMDEDSYEIIFYLD